MKQINLGQKDIIHFVGIARSVWRTCSNHRNMGFKIQGAIKIKIKYSAVQNLE